MHCLYCDRPLALLKRLTGDGQFCSKEHRKIYQKEHNQLALARLLETQSNNNSKGKRAGDAPSVRASPPVPPPAAKREEGHPQRAGFIPESFPEVRATSDGNRSNRSSG